MLQLIIFPSLTSNKYNSCLKITDVESRHTRDVTFVFDIVKTTKNMIKFTILARCILRPEKYLQNLSIDGNFKNLLCINLKKKRKI